MRAPRRPVVLVILDGLSGEAPDAGGLAAKRALPRLAASAVSTELVASGPVVGGAEGAPFATDLAYRAIGTGRPASRHEISDSIADVGYLEPLDAVIGHAQANAGVVTDFMSQSDRARCRVHVFGLVSDAPAQKSVAPLLAILEALTDRELPVALHAILDGRDMPKKSAWRALEDVVDFVAQRSGGTVLGTVMGRAYALDATGDWQKTLAAYHALVMPGPGEDDEEPRVAASAYDALSDAYEDGFVDFDLPPTRIGGFTGITGQLSCEFGSTQPEWEWNADDVAIFALPSADEAAQLASVLVRRDLPEHVAARLMLRGRKVRPFDVGSLVTLAPVPRRPELRAVFAPPQTATLLGAAHAAGRSTIVIGDRSRSHAVAFALEGGRDHSERQFDCAEALGALKTATDAVRTGEADFVVVSLGSVDHALVTGETASLRERLEVIDGALDALAQVVKKEGGALVVTSSHARALEPDADGHRGVTPGAVPLVVASHEPLALRDSGSLVDVAPTVLALLGVSPVEGMQGASLVVRKGA
jgi:2,3-bisphosphoglycerate-independent phosphoglycerate mutase